MRVLIGIGVLLAIAALWIFAGDRIAEVSDRLFTGNAVAQPVDPMRIHGSDLVIGTRKWPLPGPVVFAHNSGEKITFTRWTGLPWPTPFYGLFMMKSPPRWARYVYDRFLWTKPDGSSLEVVWRQSQRLWPNGWADEYNNQVILFRAKP
jgi:hypothetical protein